MGNGLTLSGYAAVRTAELEGFAKGEALAREGVVADDFERDAEAWEELLGEPLAIDGELGEAYERALTLARARYARVIDPLERDLEAWVRFHRWFLTHERPDAALARVGLRTLDLARLVGLWAERAAREPALADKTHALMSASAPPEPPLVTTRPRSPDDAPPPPLGDEWTLARARAWLEDARTRDAATPKRHLALPGPEAPADLDDEPEADEGDGDDERARASAGGPATPLPAGKRPPPLVVPLPREETRALEALEAARAATPGASGAPATTSPRAPSMPAPPMHDAAPPSMSAVPSYMLGQQGGASGISSPVSPMSSMGPMSSMSSMSAAHGGAAYPPPAPVPPVPSTPHATPLSGAQPPARQAPPVGTMMAMNLLEGPALPFQEKKGAPPAPPPPTGPTTGAGLPFQQGARTSQPPAGSAHAPTPAPSAVAAAPASDLGSTTFSPGISVASTLPFARGVAAPAAVSTSAPSAAPSQPLSTGTMMAMSLDAGPATPFEGAPVSQRSSHLPPTSALPMGAPQAPSAAAAAEMSLEQYASLLEDMAASPDKAAVLARYRLTPELHKALEITWTQRLLRDPTVAKRLTEAREKYRAWLQGRR